MKTKESVEVQRLKAEIESLKSRVLELAGANVRQHCELTKLRIESATYKAIAEKGAKGLEEVVRSPTREWHGFVVDKWPEPSKIWAWTDSGLVEISPELATCEVVRVGFTGGRTAPVELSGFAIDDHGRLNLESKEDPKASQ